MIARVIGCVMAALLAGGAVHAQTGTTAARAGSGERQRTEYLRWPSNPETDFPGPKSTE